MKILIINGTPKTDGVCYSFVKKSEETAAALGVSFETIRLAGMKLNKCAMCGEGWGTCSKEHSCEFGGTDGFNEAQLKIRDADAFIFISPVYWGEVSEDMKIFLDKLRRCQASKQWNGREDEVSFLKGKPSILVASAGGGGGGIITCLADMERAISHMGGDARPKETAGIFDYIAVNRWNKEYKMMALKEAITAMVKLQIK